MSIASMLLWSLLAVQAAPAAPSAAPAPAQVAGAWALATEVHGNTSAPSCTFKQEGTALTGTCTSPEGADQPATGEVTEKKVKFKYDIVWDGSPLTLHFNGTLESETEMKGAIDVQPMGVAGGFTAKKKG